MINFELFFEKIKNPLRKQDLADKGISRNNEWAKEDAQNWRAMIETGIGITEDDVDDLKIRDTYLKLKTSLPPRAKQLLDNLEKQKEQDWLRTKITPDNKLLFNKNGFEVYLDKTVTENFLENSLHWKTLNSVVSKMQNHLMGLVPIRKPKIIVIDMKKFRHAINTNVIDAGNIRGLYRDRIIYLDQFAVDDASVLIHEMAHYIVDLIPKQTEPILKHEYEKMLDEYIKPKENKKKRLTNLEPSKSSNEESIAKVRAMRDKVAKHFGYPSQYGMANFDEFWAEIITHWHDMPNNKITYRFKQIAKKIMARLV